MKSPLWVRRETDASDFQQPPVRSPVIRPPLPDRVEERFGADKHGDRNGAHYGGIPAGVTRHRHGPVPARTERRNLTT